MPFPASLDRRVLYAAAGAAVIGAQYIAGKAARDALFLAYFDPSSLPPMIIGTSVFSIALVVATSKWLGRVSPAAYVPIAFAVSAGLLLLEWSVLFAAPQLAAPVLYLQVSGIGPLLGSGFWLIASEQFDPRSAKKRFGQIAAAGTIGGLVAGVAAAQVSTRLGVGALLPVLAALNLVCAWQARALARGGGQFRPAPAPSADGHSGLRVLKETPYLRHLALVVFFGTVGAALVDYVFKVQVKAAMSGGAGLGSFFSLYHAGVSLATFLVQTFGSHAVLQKFGMTTAMSTPSASLLLGGTASLAFPGFPAVVGTRAGEAVFRGSLLKAGYELFYTPVSRADKRAVKAVIDVGVDRSGDILAAGVIQLLLWAAPPVGVLTTLTWLTLGCALVTIVFGSRLNRGYLAAIKNCIIDRAAELDVDGIADRQTRTVILETLTSMGMRPADAATQSTATEAEDVAILRSADLTGVKRVLRRTPPPSRQFVLELVPWLAEDEIAGDVIRTLRRRIDQDVGALSDVLLDPQTPFSIRRRLVRVFAAATTQRAVDSLMYALGDLRFEVRYQCARSLEAIRSRNPRTGIDPHRVLDAVRREVRVSRRVWESRQLLEGVGSEPADALIEMAVDNRANRALEHVFTLLGLVFPGDPLRIAYRALHTGDAGFRGTALEYLEGVLPADIREPLWPFLDADAVRPAQARPHQDVIDELLRSQQSILLSLDTRRKGAAV